MRPLPATQRAIQFVAPDRVLLNPAKPVPAVGPTQVLVEVEAVGICFSDTKLLHAFATHPRKNPILTGLDEGTLAEIPSYVPGDLATVPGHEVCGRIVAVGADVKRHRVGERCLVQTDYRHLPTDGANASFGYNFEGGLQEYVLMDERVIIEPATGERFLIPVAEAPSASAVALLEPWACVERAYATQERGTLRVGGALLVIADPGHDVVGLAELLQAARPRAITAVLAEAGQRSALAAQVGTGHGRGEGSSDGAIASDATDLAALAAGSFDDIVYFGADPERIEQLQALLGPKGVIDVVLGGRRLGRPVEVDVGRIHYDLLRWVGTTGDSAAAGYAMAPASGELRDGERVAVIGAAGPMGFMHVIRALTSGRRGLSVTAVDIDDTRLAHLAEVATPVAEAQAVAFEWRNSRRSPLAPGFTRIGVMVPSPTLAAEAVGLAGQGAIIDLFAGFAVGTRAPLDLDELLAKQAYLIGTSGSMIDDMKAVLAKLEAGTLDTNISVDAVSGLGGVADALAAVQARTSGGKIVIFPKLASTGMITLPELPARFPEVAAALDHGRWTRAAEEALLAAAAAEEALLAATADDALLAAAPNEALLAAAADDGPHA